MEICGKVQLPQSLGELPKTLQKLRLSAKLLHQEIRWNYGILPSVTCKKVWCNVLKTDACKTAKQEGVKKVLQKKKKKRKKKKKEKKEKKKKLRAFPVLQR